VLGFGLLKLAPGSRRKPLWWLGGASLSRVLPVIEINKEFSDFFNDPERKNLKGWQIALFSVMVLVGWFLGLLLVAAMTGLIQHS
jgi:hypothetical protein